MATCSNEDANWDERFWDIDSRGRRQWRTFSGVTRKTEFQVGHAMRSSAW